MKMLLWAVVTFSAVVLALISYLFVPLWCHLIVCLAMLIPIVAAKRLMATKPSLSNHLLQSWYLGYILLTSLVGHLSILASIAVSGMFSDRDDAKFLTDYLGGGVTALFASVFFEPFEKQKGGFWPEPMFRQWFETANRDLKLKGNADEKRAFDAVNQERVYDNETGETLADGWNYAARATRADIVEKFRAKQPQEAKGQ
ncbi:hypothetical protein [Henriciella aquimarina]|uniref:hypothetical protein n=1 Tax=Henriciella aquimarina TaxID=545261 RepID=UPI000A0567E1|nr:hypothetical protein [Henriciella aquimarina]